MSHTRIIITAAAHLIAAYDDLGEAVDFGEVEMMIRADRFESQLEELRDALSAYIRPVEELGVLFRRCQR